MSDDIVKRLRAKRVVGGWVPLCREAADEITRLREQLVQFDLDWADMKIVEQYGRSPGGWNAERVSDFGDALTEAEVRHMAFVLETRRGR